jgi:hypothetical protein
MPDPPPDAAVAAASRVRWRVRLVWWVTATTFACLVGLVATTGLSWFGFTVMVSFLGGIVVGTIGFVASVLIDAAMEDRFGEHSLITSTVSAVGAFVATGSLALLIGRGITPASLIVVAGCAVAAAVPWAVEARRRGARDQSPAG